MHPGSPAGVRPGGVQPQPGPGLPLHGEAGAGAAAGGAVRAEGEESLRVRGSDSQTTTITGDRLLTELPYINQTDDHILCGMLAVFSGATLLCSKY